MLISSGHRDYPLIYGSAIMRNHYKRDTAIMSKITTATTATAPVATTATTANAPVATTANAPVATTANAPVATTATAPVATTANAPVATTANAPVALTAAQLKAQFQAIWDSKPTSGQRAAFTKRLEAMGVPQDQMPLATKKPIGHADDAIILALLAQFKG
jgi:hypothetical protein